MGQSANWSIPSGYRASAVKAGIKPSGGLDLTVLVADADCSAAGTFTTNRVCAAPVRWDRKLVPSETVRAIVVNAGNANAATERKARRTSSIPQNMRRRSSVVVPSKSSSHRPA